MLFSSRKTAGIIGLGIIGTRVAQNLRAAGHTVYVYNRSPRPVPNFLGSPAQVAEHCQLIQVFVRDSADLIEVMERLAQGPLGEKHVVINSATVAPEAAERAAKIAREKGAGFVNAPFMGSKAAAEKGALIYFTGGEDSALKKAQVILSASAREIVPVGTVRQAALIKLAANSLISVQLAGFAEVLGFVERAGIEPERFLKALEPTVARSPIMEMKAPGILGQEYEAHFTLANMLKDSRLASEAARGIKQDTPLGDAVNAVFQRGVAEGLGDLDFSAIAKLFLPSQATRPVEGDSAVEKVVANPAPEPGPEPEARIEEPAPTSVQPPAEAKAETAIETAGAPPPATKPEPEPEKPVVASPGARRIMASLAEEPKPALKAVPPTLPESQDFVVLPPPEPDFDSLPKPSDPPKRAPGSRISRLERDMPGSPLARRITPLPGTPAKGRATATDWEPVKRQMDLPLSMPPPPPPPNPASRPAPTSATPATQHKGPPQDPSFTFTQEDLDSLPSQDESPVVAAKPVLPGRAGLPKETPFIPNRPRLPEDEEPAE